MHTHAKDLARNYFYRKYLPSRLTHDVLRGGSYLVLLGEEDAELTLLRELGVPGYRIYSVERDPAIATQQGLRTIQGEIDVSLYSGELVDFIQHHLAMNRRFQVMNLDVAGSYLTNIDEAMTNVLLFARWNPQTVIATYSSAGRDRSTYLEGIKSLALCLLIAPEETETAINALYGRYRTANRKPEVCRAMVLRHLFWVRSHWEHVLLGAASLNRVTSDDAWGLLDELDRFWKPVSAELPRPITLEDLRKAVAQHYRSVTPLAGFDLRIRDVELLTYLGNSSHYQLGWFTSYEPVASLTLRDWLIGAFDAINQHPLLYADTEDTEDLRRIDTATEAIGPKSHLWNKERFPRHQRSLSIPTAVGFGAILSEFVASNPVPLPPLESTNATTTQSATQLTPEQKVEIKKRALQDLALSGDDLVLEYPGVDVRSLSAIIAVGRRALKKAN